METNNCEKSENNAMELNGKRCSDSSSEDADSGFCCKGKITPAKGKKKKTKFTFQQKVSLVMLAMADFMSVCSMSIISPFYPAESTRKGVSGSLSGLVFGTYALVVFLTSPIFGKVLPRFGAKCMFISGLFVSGIASVAFGLVDRLENYTLFLAASFIIRSFGALGASAYGTASFVLIINIFPDNAGAVRGLLETFVGLGLTAGPALGGLLYGVGGFGLPFYVVGVVTIVIALLNLYHLPKPEKNDLEKRGSLINLLKLPSVVVTCIIITITAITSSYLDPTLEPHLRKFDLSPCQVGLLFLLVAVTYGIFSPIWGIITDKLDDYTWLMTTGLFGTSVVLLFLGPSPVLTFLEDSIWLNAAALLALGVFMAMPLIPTYQFILDSAMANGFQENLGTHSVIAGLWVSIYSLGEVIGPVAAGTLMENFDFPVTSTTVAFINFVGAVGVMIYFKLRSTKIKVLLDNRGFDNVLCHIEIEAGIGTYGSSAPTSVKSINDDNVVNTRL